MSSSWSSDNIVGLTAEESGASMATKEDSSTLSTHDGDYLMTKSASSTSFDNELHSLSHTTDPSTAVNSATAGNGSQTVLDFTAECNRTAAQIVPILNDANNNSTTTTANFTSPLSVASRSELSLECDIENSLLRRQSISAIYMLKSFHEKQMNSLKAAATMEADQSATTTPTTTSEHIPKPTTATTTTPSHMPTIVINSSYELKGLAKRKQTTFASNVASAATAANLINPTSSTTSMSSSTSTSTAASANPHLYNQHTESSLNKARAGTTASAALASSTNATSSSSSSTTPRPSLSGQVGSMAAPLKRSPSVNSLAAAESAAAAALAAATRPLATQHLVLNRTKDQQASNSVFNRLHNNSNAKTTTPNVCTSPPHSSKIQPAANFVDPNSTSPNNENATSILKKSTSMNSLAPASISANSTTTTTNNSSNKQGLVTSRQLPPTKMSSNAGGGSTLNVQAGGVKESSKIAADMLLPPKTLRHMKQRSAERQLTSTNILVHSNIPPQQQQPQSTTSATNKANLVTTFSEQNNKIRKLSNSIQNLHHSNAASGSSSTTKAVGASAANNNKAGLASAAALKPPNNSSSRLLASKASSIDFDKNSSQKKTTSKESVLQRMSSLGYSSTAASKTNVLSGQVACEQQTSSAVDSDDQMSTSSSQNADDDNEMNLPDQAGCGGCGEASSSVGGGGTMNNENMGESSLLNSKESSELINELGDDEGEVDMQDDGENYDDEENDGGESSSQNNNQQQRDEDCEDGDDERNENNQLSSRSLTTSGSSSCSVSSFFEGNNTSATAGNGNNNNTKETNLSTDTSTLTASNLTTDPLLPVSKSAELAMVAVKLGSFSKSKTTATMSGGRAASEPTTGLDLSINSSGVGGPKCSAGGPTLSGANGAGPKSTGFKKPITFASIATNSSSAINLLPTTNNGNVHTSSTVGNFNNVSTGALSNLKVETILNEFKQNISLLERMYDQVIGFIPI